jgi:hypothetical protein
MSLVRVCVALMVAVVALGAVVADARLSLDSGVPLGAEQLRQHTQRPLLKHPALVDAMDGNGTLPKFPKLGKVYVSGVSSGGERNKQILRHEFVIGPAVHWLRTVAGLIEKRMVQQRCTPIRARVALQLSTQTDLFFVVCCCFALVQATWPASCTLPTAP